MLAHKQMQTQANRVRMVALAAMMALPTTALASGDAVEIYKAQSGTWQRQMHMIELDKALHDSCGIATDYDRLEADIRWTAAHRFLFGKGVV